MTDKEKELQEELDRIKNGIKHCETTMIVDGNDMFDWGWTTQAIKNQECHERGLPILSEVKWDYIPAEEIRQWIKQTLEKNKDYMLRISKIWGK